MTKKPSPQNLTIYLGAKELRLSRTEHLDELARKALGDVPGARSKLIQLIADGVFDKQILARAATLTS